jgi:hypothetical protein
VRNGDPDALAGLCARRGPAVLAYCERVAGVDNASAAAADAFRRFRTAVIAATDLSNLNPEALLMSATRHAAAQFVPRPADSPDVLRFVARRPATGWCGDVPSLLAARADRTISTIDLARLGQHLDGCPACRAPEARFEAAERAYRDPPTTPLPLPATAAIMAALSAAGPVSPSVAASNGAGPAPAGAANGARPVPPSPPEPVSEEVHEANGDAIRTPPPPIEVPTVRTPVAEVVPPPPVEPVAPPPPPPVQEIPPLPPAPALPPRPEPPATELHVTVPEPPAPSSFQAWTPDVDTATSEYRIPEFVDLGERGEARSREDRGRTRPALPALPSLSLSGLRGRLPKRRKRPQTRRPRPGSSAVGSTVLQPVPGRRTRFDLATVLPLVLVLGAIVVGLAVAGVFGGGSGAESPASKAPTPTAPSSSGQPPDVLVVPGGSASAAAVEAAKARARAKARRAARQAQGSAGSSSGASSSAASSGTSGQSAQPASTPPPPPPPPAAQSQGQGATNSPKVNGGRSAAGSGQSPDTSNVPPLSPTSP